MNGIDLRVLSVSNYRLFFWGQLISVIGSAMQVMMETMLVYRLSNSSFELGAINFCAQWAACMACPVAGAIVDRFNKRKLLIGVELVGMVQALVLALLCFFSVVEIWQIACLTIVLGVVNAFEMSSRHAFTLELVGRVHLASAIRLNSIALNLGRGIGPAVAGALCSLVGRGREEWGFALNATTFIAVLLALLLLDRKALFVYNVPAPARELTLASFLTDIKYGVKRAWEVPVIRKILVFMTALCFLSGSYIVLYPSIAERLLSGEAGGLGLLSGATGIGALVGVLNGNIERRSDELVWRTLLMNAILLGASFLFLGCSTFLCMSIGGAFGVGFFLFSAFPLANIAIQERVGDAERGRIISLLPMAYFGAAPVGGLVLGYLIDRYGAQLATVLTGMSCIMFGFAARLIR